MPMVPVGWVSMVPRWRRGPGMPPLIYNRWGIDIAGPVIKSGNNAPKINANIDAAFCLYPLWSKGGGKGGKHQ